MTFIILFNGYSAFRPWSVENFFIYYTMLILGKSSFPKALCGNMSLMPHCSIRSLLRLEVVETH